MGTPPEENYLEKVTSDLAFVLTNERNEIVFCSLHAASHLIVEHGLPATSLVKAVEAPLRPSLTAALARARHCESTVAFFHGRKGEHGQQGALLVTIRPLQAGAMGDAACMILFDTVEQTEEEGIPLNTANQNLIPDLYAELMRSRDEFHRLTLDNEETVNNLASLNEELYSINEELRATSNELQTNRDTLEAGNALLTEMVSRISKANDDLENFVEATELALVFVDRDMRIIRFTAPARTVFRVMPGDVGRSLLDISHCLKYQALEDDISSVLLRREKVEREVRSTDGTWFCLRVIPYTDEATEVIGAIIILLDISLRKEAEENLRSGEERWRAALEATGDGIWEWDIPANRCLLSPAWRKILGYASDEIASGAMQEWQALIHPEDRAEVVKSIEAAGNGEPGWFSHEYRIKCKDGHWKWALSRGAVVERGHDGKARRLIGTLSDISHKKNAEHEIWYRANYDSLTGLPNRSFFLDRLGYEVMQAKRSAQTFAVLFIDLDRFKEVNDLHGHSAGDLLLRMVADALKASVRESDTVARLGGDEFTVLLTATTDSAQVELIAEEIVKRLAEPMNVAGHAFHISASIGITFFPKDAGSADDLIRNADQAMYVAKNAGRNCCRFFSQKIQDEVIARIRITNDLHDAGDGQLQLVFHPIVDMSTGKIAKAEALLRWRHPTRGMLQPDHFIHLAEEAGLINRIGDWVFTEAATAALRLGNLCDGQFQISLNKSPLEFSSKNNLPKLDWILHLKEIGLNPSSCIIEITEGLLLHATGETMELIGLLRQAGIQFALDDFGTGYSSMSYLANYNVDFLKIDKSFVTRCNENSPSSAIVEAMILLAHRLGLKVVAEGVETQEQHDWLRAAGCDYSQGFLYSRPMDIDALEETVRKSFLQPLFLLNAGR
jgi:diguanylate cyclase (GGDEF)-like protein/PAS domain S-box-containing protein